MSMRMDGWVLQKCNVMEMKASPVLEIALDLIKDGPNIAVRVASVSKKLL